MVSSYARAKHISSMRLMAWVLALFFAMTMVGSAEQTTIEFIYLAGAEATEQAHQVLVDAFEAANPDIKVERYRFIGDLGARLTTLIATGTVPDVIALDMHDVMAFGDERFLYDLTPFIEKTPQYEGHVIPPPALDVYTVDGKLFAAPFWANPSAYYLNIDLFDQSGLVSPTTLYPNGEWTWESFRDAARRITRIDGSGKVTVLGASLHNPRTWIATNGGREFDDPKRPTRTYYESPEAMEALRFLQDMITQDRSMTLNSSTRSVIGVDYAAGFNQNMLGMTSRWMATLPSLAQGGQTLGIVPYPKGPGPGGQHASDFGMFGLAISKDTKNLEAAWRLVSFLTGPEGAAIESTLPGRTPPRPIFPEWLSQTVVNPEVYPELLNVGQSRVISKNRPEIQGIINTELAKVWRNEVSVENAVAEITRRVSSLLE